MGMKSHKKIGSHFQPDAIKAPLDFNIILYIVITPTHHSIASTYKTTGLPAFACWINSSYRGEFSILEILKVTTAHTLALQRLCVEC